MHADQLNSYVSVSRGFGNGIRAQLDRPDHVFIEQPRQAVRVHCSLDQYEGGQIGPAYLLADLLRISSGNMVARWNSRVPGLLKAQDLYSHSPEIENLGAWPQQFSNIDPRRPGYLGTRLWRSMDTELPAHLEAEFTQNFHALGLLLNANSLGRYLNIKHPWGLTLPCGHDRKKSDGSPLSAAEAEAWRNFKRSNPDFSNADRARYNIKSYRHYDLLDPLVILGINVVLRGENAFHARLTTFEPDQDSPEASTETDLTSQDCVRELVLDDTRPVEISFIKRLSLKVHKQGCLHPLILLIHDLFHLVSQGKQSEALKALKVRMDELAQQAAGSANPWLASVRTTIWDAPMVTAEEFPISLGLAGARILRDIGLFAKDVSEDFYYDHPPKGIKPEYRAAWFAFKTAFFDLIRQEYAHTSFYHMSPQIQKMREDPSLERGMASWDYLERNLGYVR